MYGIPEKRTYVCRFFAPNPLLDPNVSVYLGCYMTGQRSGKGFPVLGSGNNKYQLMDVEDFCAAIYLSTTIDAVTANDTFNVGAKIFTTIKEDYQVVLDRAGFGKKIPVFRRVWRSGYYAF